MVKTNDSRFSFEKQLPDTGHIYQILDGNYSISVSFPDAKEGIVAIIDNPDPDIGGKTKLERLTEVETLSSSVTYSNVLPGIDLRYTLVSNDTKEDIIVKEPCESYSYSFEIATDGLSVRCENGKIIFGDILTSKDVYYIPVPFMYDDIGEVSYEVFYSLEELQQNYYRLTVTANDKWINSAERRFPVIIDPSLTDIAQIDDTFVASVTPGTNYGGTHELTVANNMEVYYKFATPHLPSGTNITSASFKVPYFYYVGTSNYVTVELYKVTSNWYEDIVTWNTKPTVSTCLDTRDIYQNGATASNPGIVSFSATNYIQSWYTGTSNYGFALKYAGGNGVSVSFVAKEKMQIFAQIVIYYQGTHLSEGIYAIQKQGSNCYFESYRPATLAWVLQDTTFTSPPLTTDHLENLFKLAYRPANDDYVIRSMIDSSLVIYPSVSNGAPIAGFRTESDSSMPAGYTWKIEKTGDYYYITYTQNGVKYYIRSNSTNNGYKLVLTTNPNDTGTKWIFNSYTGNTYEDIEMENYESSIYVGDTVSYKSFMRSTRIGHNGPVSYSVTNADSGNTSTDKAEINSSTGDLLAKKPGSIRIRVSYPGAPWVWIWNVVINGTFVSQAVPTSLRSNTDHSCIPCAITNVASFWCVSEGLYQYNCETVQQLESRAQEVQNAMNQAGSCTANDYIQYGFNIFTHVEDNIVYTLSSNNCWAYQNAFDWESIENEIDFDRPVMMGFSSAYGSPYYSHMTVCAGYAVDGEIRYVYLSDAHDEGYVRQVFSESYNDFISKVELVIEDLEDY